MAWKLAWTGYGGYLGWAHYGTRKASELLPGEDFWSKAVRVAASAEGGKVDAVQCYDSGIMTAGPLQATAKFHYLQHLLATCYNADNEGFVKCMIPAMYTDNADPIYPLLPNPKVPGGWSICLPDGTPAITNAQLQKVFLGGSNGRAWSSPQKAHAKQWVECLTELLQCFDAEVAIHSGWLLRRFFSEKARQQIAGLELDEVERDRLTACHLAYSINNPASAQRILSSVVTQKAPRPNHAAYLAIAGVSRPDTFPKRVAATRARILAEWPA